jgi:hypothetical protein
MTLFQAVLDCKFRTFSVIGLAKNVGKTTTLNYLMEMARLDGAIRLGITSSGWDGEAYDSITGQPKPRIVTPAGALIATTVNCLAASALKYRVIRKTGMSTSLGEVLIIECTEEGRVEVAGPTTIMELCQVRDIMLDLGADLILFDGALNRKASASPEVCQAMILATGLNAGYNLEEVKRTTSFWLEIFSLPAWEGEKPGLSESDEKKALLTDREGRAVCACSAGDIAGCIDKAFDGYVFLPGAFTEILCEGLLKSPGRFDIVVGDATKVFIPPLSLRRLKKRGSRIIQLSRTDIIGVTANPTSSSGRAYDARDFLKTVADISHGIPVWDIVLGEGLESSHEGKAEA